MTDRQSQVVRRYIPIPDAPTAGRMLNVEALPAEVIAALRVCRDYEAETAVNATLLDKTVRAWFRYQWRRENP